MFSIQDNINKNKNLKKNKNDFKKITKLLKYIDTHNLFKWPTYYKILNISISIIKKYENKNNWFLNKYLELFFFCHNKYICPTEDNIKFIKIKYIIQKCKVSNILKLFVIKTNYLSPTKIKSISHWVLNNKYLFYCNLRGIIFLIPYLIQDLIIPTKFELCTNDIEQLIFIIYNYNQI